MHTPVRPTALKVSTHCPSRQRGIALFVVIMFVMLSMLLSLWASRTAWFNELVVSNDADYQRAFEAAQALLLDAELDIRGENANGSVCSGSGKICRTGTAIAKIPLEASGAEGVAALLVTLEDADKRCKDGLCAKRLGRQDFWNYPSADAMTPDDLKAYEHPLKSLSATGVGARYGEYTGASASNNPILETTSTTPWNQGGWYWIEVLNYDTSSEFSNVIIDPAASSKKNLLTLNLLPAVVYRITAVAYGRKPGSMAVLQETYARTRLKD
ncbi:MAG: hypothetical protein RBR77_00565 [Thauera sp.]|nr:hypothetical protein [Thauera sp.]